MNGTFTHKKHIHTHTNYNPPVIMLLILHSFEGSYNFYRTFTHGSCSSGPGSIVCHLSICICLSTFSFIKYATCWQAEAQFVIHYLTPAPSLSNIRISEYQNRRQKHAMRFHSGQSVDSYFELTMDKMTTCNVTGDIRSD